jgi:hypothetical protein
VNKSPRYLEKPPKWAGAGFDFQEPDSFGGTPEISPRLPTRLMPFVDDHRVSATVLRDVIDRTQHLVYLAAEITAHGPNPELHDVRHIDRAMRNMVTLQVSPFGEGSFVIPAELPISEVTVDGERGGKVVTTSAVVAKFIELMGQLSDKNNQKAFELPIGVIQTVEDIGKVFERHLKGIEYAGYAEQLGEEPKLVSVNSSYVEFASAVRKIRRGRMQSGFATLEGELLSLDLIKQKAKIRYTRKDTEEQHVAVAVFDTVLSELLVRRMAKEITVFGPATYRRGRIAEIQIVHIEKDPGDE